jgi:tetratricopeptide (TPR) repeat protein
VTRQFDRAIELYQRQAQMNLGNFNPHMQLAYLFALTGRRPEAVSEWQKMVTTLGYEDLSNAIGRAYRVGGYNNALGVFVRELEVSSHSTYIPAWYIASVYGFKGDKDQAFAWLERAYTEKEDGVDTLNEPIWDPLRSDPRFQDLLRRVGLPR